MEAPLVKVMHRESPNARERSHCCGPVKKELAELSQMKMKQM